jgi:undecaprenyl-diphosphatase
LTESSGGTLAAGQALLLGALHGPAELMPVSSSGHVSTIPWLLCWDYHRLDSDLRKAFEVALHAGTAAALLITLRDEVGDAIGSMDATSATVIVLCTVPPAIAGYLLERPIERRLGTPPTVAAGLIIGSLAMAWADRAPQTRRWSEAGVVDGLWLGAAQSCALIPGVSRSGATLAAARARRFTREDSGRLSRHAALPVITGATALKGFRLMRRGVPRRSRLPFALGAMASFGSTLISTRLIAQVQRDRSLLPYAVYRTALASAVLIRLGRGRSAGCTTMST